MFLKVVQEVDKKLYYTEMYSVSYSKFNFYPKQVKEGQKNTSGGDRYVYGIGGWFHEYIHISKLTSCMH